MDSDDAFESEYHEPFSGGEPHLFDMGDEEGEAQDGSGWFAESPAQSPFAKRQSIERVSDEKISRTLSYILRHGALRHSIPIDEEGFIKYEDAEAFVRTRHRGVLRAQVERVLRASISPEQGLLIFETKLLHGERFVRARFELTERGDTIKSVSRVRSLAGICLDYISSNMVLFSSYDVPNFLQPAMTEVLIQKLKSKNLFTNKIFREHFITPHITSLDFSGTFVTESALRDMGKTCASVQKLVLSKQVSVTDNSLPLAVKSMDNLRALILSECINISSKGIISSSKKWANLTQLNLSKCSHIGDDALVKIAHVCANLEALDISYMHLVSDNGLIPIIDKCGKLISVNCIQVPLITDESLRAVSLNLQRIEKLLLRGNSNVSDGGVSSILQTCPHIRFLSVAHCDKITSASAEKILQSPCRIVLEFLDLSKCCISAQTLLALPRNLPELRVLVVANIPECTFDVADSLHSFTALHVITESIE